jgi:hypothetical protein
MALLLAAAADAGAPAARSGRKDGRDVYVVEMSGPPLALYRGGVPGLGATDPRSRGERKLDVGRPESRRYAEHLLKQQGETLAAIRGKLGRDVAALRQYTHAFAGMALELSREEADRISRMPGVLRVRRSRAMHLLSDAGPAWTGAPGIWNGTQTGGLPGTQGEGVVIGILDSGINMDHPSFADVGGDGYDHANPRGAGNYVGWCDPANPKYSPSLHCNDKLIGVWSFQSGDNPEDDRGHGTQLASVAAGNHVNAPVPGTSLTRQISGVAPHANLISYDVCWSYYSCYETEILAGIDQAVADGVDVLNLSLGGYSSGDPWENAVSQALLAAREAGVIVTAGAGNNGPWSESISVPASSPWVLAAGASTHDRRLAPKLVGLSGGSTTPPTLTGYGFSNVFGPAAIVSAGAYGDEECYSPFPAGTFPGKIVVCSVSPYSDGQSAVSNAQAGGAGGVVLANWYDNGYEVPSSSYSLPAVRLDELQAEVLWDWLSSGSGHTARIDATAALTSPSYADVVADFSSRGPNWPRDVVRPDLLAPGVSTFAASSDPEDYAIRSGTSLASAFAAGAAALVLDLHPDWTPGEVQSALMTTARSSGLRLSNGSSTTSPFDIGAGRLDLGAAGRAGLVLDETVTRFEQADPELGGLPADLNLASLANAVCTLDCSWTRVVRSTLSTTSHWTATVSPPPGTTATVTPSSFTLGPGATQSIQIALSGPGDQFGWSFGALTLTETGAQAPLARLPIATRWVSQLKLTVNKSGDGTGRVVSSPAGIDCGPTCAAPFPDDDLQVTLTATPDPGSAFVGWSGGYCGGPENPCSFPLWYNQQVTAWFNVQPPDRALANRAGVKDGISGPVAGGSWKYYFADLGSGNDQLVVDLFDLAGDATLYVRSSQKPDWSHYNCVDSDYYGLPNRRCVISAPAAGRWWIGVVSEQTGPIQYSVRASWGSNADQALQNGVPVGDFVSAAQPGAGWKYYYLDLVGASSELVVDLEALSADADLFVRRGAKPDRSNYDCISAAVGPGAERCTMASPEPGRWWIGVNNFSAGTVTYTAQAAWASTAGADLFTVAPCRLVDTRTSYPLQGGQSRSFLAAGHCGIPITAKAVVLNVTVLDATAGGLLTLYPDNLSVPLASTINFQAAQTRANNAVVRLSTDGEGRVGVYATVGNSGVVHLILDVAGYYE